MSSQYFAILTEYGTQAFAKALSSKQPLQLTTFAVGDGNGQAITPTANRTALVRETHRATVSAVTLDPRNNKQVIVELTIPENVGGFYIREMGVFDNQNKLVAYANCPESFKPTETSGSGKVQVLRMVLKVASSDAVTLKIDSSTIFATRPQLTPKIITATTKNSVDDSGHTHEIDKASTSKAGVVQLSSANDSDDETKAATPKAIKALKALIDAITRNLNNYIPSSKKSNAVNSNSADTVATSAAVKTAYDKAVAADNNANNRVPKSGNTTITGELRAKHPNLGLGANWSNYQWESKDGYWRMEVHPESKPKGNTRFNMVFAPFDGQNQSYLSFPDIGSGDIVAYRSWAVNKAGDTLTGILRTVGIASKQFGFGSYASQYTSGAPFMVDNTGSVPNDTYHPFIKGETRGKNNWGAVFSLGYTTKQGGGNGFGSGIINLIEDNGRHLNWSFEHDGSFVSAGDVRSSSGKTVNNSVQVSAISHLTNGTAKDKVASEFALGELNKQLKIKEQVIWQGSSNNEITVNVPFDTGILFVCVNKSWGPGGFDGQWLSFPIANCNNTSVGDQDTGGGDGDYNYSMELRITKNGKAVKLKPQGRRAPIIKKVVVVGV